jgi:hypothetical protein
VVGREKEDRKEHGERWLTYIRRFSNASEIRVLSWEFFCGEGGRGPENLGHVASFCDSYELVGFQDDTPKN